jgi:hypothetical protein
MKPSPPLTLTAEVLQERGKEENTRNKKKTETKMFKRLKSNYFLQRRNAEPKGRRENIKSFLLL